MPDICDSEMRPYSQFQPTGFDCRGLRASDMGHDEEDSDRSEWLVVPCGQNRDSDALERSNFRIAESILLETDPGGVDHENHRFGHWACGWLEILIVRPGSKCHSEAWEMECALADYPILSEEDYSELEYEEREDCEWCSHRGTYSKCGERGECDFPFPVGYRHCDCCGMETIESHLCSDCDDEGCCPDEPNCRGE